MAAVNLSATIGCSPESLSAVTLEPGSNGTAITASISHCLKHRKLETTQPQLRHAILPTTHVYRNSHQTYAPALAAHRLRKTICHLLAKIY
jgi:hypothetical protein